MEAAAQAVAAPLDAAFEGMVAPPPEELPPDNIMAAETEALLAEVEALSDELIGHTRGDRGCADGRMGEALGQALRDPGEDGQGAGCRGGEPEA